MNFEYSFFAKKNNFTNKINDGIFASKKYEEVYTKQTKNYQIVIPK